MTNLLRLHSSFLRHSQNTSTLLHKNAIRFIHGTTSSTRTTISKTLFSRSSILSSSCSFPTSWTFHIIPMDGQIVRFKHTVRVVFTQDVSQGKGYYAGEIHSVAAGYARNYLIPEKKALYATPFNLQQRILIPTKEEEGGVSMGDPKKDQKIPSRSDATKEDRSEDVKAADFLRHYLRNKVLKVWRNVDSRTLSTDVQTASESGSSSSMSGTPIYPGFVDSTVLQQKFSKQLKIDLNVDLKNDRIDWDENQIHHEWIEICTTPIPHDTVDELTEQGRSHMDEILQSHFASTVDKETFEKNKMIQIKQLGEYVAKIHLKGNQAVGLRFVILKR